jgi:hypothetical protein
MADRKLAHPITLKDGTVLAKDSDVVRLFERAFATVTRHDPLKEAIRLLVPFDREWSLLILLVVPFEERALTSPPYDIRARR